MKWCKLISFFIKLFIRPPPAYWAMSTYKYGEVNAKGRIIKTPCELGGK